MSEILPIHRIDKIRSAARHIVRELGFMQSGLAGTDLSPSAVHTIIELGYGTVTTASDLGALLHLEKSSVSRLVQKLEKDGLIASTNDSADKRARALSLTDDGQTAYSQMLDVPFSSRLPLIVKDNAVSDCVGIQRKNASYFYRADSSQVRFCPRNEPRGIHLVLARNRSRGGKREDLKYRSGFRLCGKLNGKKIADTFRISARDLLQFDIVQRSFY